MDLRQQSLGSKYLGDRKCQFSVWAPEKNSVELKIVSPATYSVRMLKDDDGYFKVTVDDVEPGSHYFFSVDDKKNLPDPASHFQPQGVHGPSEVVDHASFVWRDDQWRGIPFQELIIYELHVGTFTEEGTFEAIIPRLNALSEMGINAIELLPVSQFPGERNWGYDGVFPYAVQDSYGGPSGLKNLVNACHQKGIAVFLDVVYNHLGPEGNYFSQFAPYFTKKYSTPWGEALNFDGPYSDGVRFYFASNPAHWFENYHLDGLRVDAIHMVFDSGAVHFWELLNDNVKACQARLGRSLHLIAESDLNNPRIIQPTETGGYGFTAQWLDDFHHALYVVLDKKGKERYYDFGSIEQLAKAYKDGFVHSGEYVKFRKRKHGRSSSGINGNKFVVFNLNHDQAGNRIHGERLCVLIDFERLKIAATALLLSPYVPMLFMGEEYADPAPFYYFVSHSDAALVKAVQRGRKEEFKDYIDEGEPPDPQNPKTFHDSKLIWDKRNKGEHSIMLAWHKKLIGMRNEISVLKNFNKNDITPYVLGHAALVLHRQSACRKDHLLCMFNFSEHEIMYRIPTDLQRWVKILDSREKQWLKDQATTALMPSVISAEESVMILPLGVFVYRSNLF
jgi:maltooligosyltrehalose trehalohydrolase